jgi:hypothetical protein
MSGSMAARRAKGRGLGCAKSTSGLRKEAAVDFVERTVRSADFAAITDQAQSVGL